MFIPGLSDCHDKLFIEPCLPSDWAAYKIHYRYRETIYNIIITQIHEGNTTQKIILDGAVCQHKFIPMVDDRLEHQAEVKVYTVAI